MKENLGQSLVEMLIAISVVIMVILALITVTTISVRNASFARNQASARGYCQEGIEKIRAYRDQNKWKNFVSGCEGILVVLSPPFSRTVDCYLESNPSQNCSETNDVCEVKVTVSWTDSQGSHKSEIRTQFTSWR